ncbi:AraC family transcriptional regulator [Streptomyces albiflavescens]|uniref:AraC family transcriptional regulator n=1 Tax=Streptomyces albiflavescens TaxID=1623582 RepID=UPI0035713F81
MYVRRAVGSIRSHLTEPLRIKEVADIAHMSTTSLHRHFKSATGTSPLQFQKRLRLHALMQPEGTGCRRCASRAARVTEATDIGGVEMAAQTQRAGSRSRRSTSQGSGARSAARRARSSGVNLALLGLSCLSRTVIWWCRATISTSLSRSLIGSRRSAAKALVTVR